jgi:hypothetical protein
MSLQRSTLVAIATLFTVGMTSVAFAGCCDWAAPAPVVYAAPSGCGVCGTQAYAPVIVATPVAPAPIYVGNGCGNCGVPSPCCSTPSAAVTFLPPVAPAPCCAMPVAAAPCCAVQAAAPCCATPQVYTAPAPLYVVNQGPDYTGPGIMEPYRTYAPPAQYAPPPVYPGYGYPQARPYYPRAYNGPHGYYPHVAYREHVYQPRALAPRYYPAHRPYWRG